MKTLISRMLDFKVDLARRARKAYWQLLEESKNRQRFPGSASYWQARYASGSNSGVGSYGPFAEFKAEVLNRFVADNSIKSVIEFGCGDGNQLCLATYPTYTGLDVSDAAVTVCRDLFRADCTKAFHLMADYDGQQAELALSLDVIYHLVEDDVYDRYMHTLFSASCRFVVVYSSNHDVNRGLKGTHVRHRMFTNWVSANAPSWRLIRHIPNRYPYKGDYQTGSFADFFIFQKTDTAGSAPP